MSKFGRFVFAMIGFSTAFGFQCYNKSAIAKEVKQQMLSLCSTDSGCQNSLNAHFKECFDSSFRMGSRHRSSSLDSNKLASCINSNAGAEYFAAY